MVDLSIIIVTYNSEDHISSCLQEIYSQPLNFSFEVLVVDNQSSDRTRILVEEFPEVQLIANDKNVGFSRANNLAVVKAAGRYVLFLNPDVILDPNRIGDLISCLESDRRYGIVAPRLLYNNGIIQESARRYPNIWVQTVARLPILNSFFQTLYDSYLMRDWDHRSSRNVDWVIGAAMLCRKEDFYRVGKFDEDFFLYCEDVDLCYRFFKHGFSVFYFSEISFIHQYQKKSSTSLSKLTFVHLSSLVKFYLKHPELVLRKVR